MNKLEVKLNPSYGDGGKVSEQAGGEGESLIWGGGKVSEQAGGEGESLIWGGGRSMNKLEVKVKVNPSYGVVAGQ